ncbi:MAG: hypothetical protein V2A79_03785 [Planctomycetota bacterium]
MKDDGKGSAGYRVQIGIDYPPNRRAEPGDVVNDLPPTDIRWLIEAGAIEPVDLPQIPRKEE